MPKILERKGRIQDAAFHCDATPLQIEAWGPLGITFRVHKDGQLYSNLHEKICYDETNPDDVYPVQLYTEILNFVTSCAVDAAKLGGVYRSPDLLAHRFIVGLLDCGVNIMKVAELNDEAELVQGICHSHDFCDANMVMLEAAESLGLHQGPPTKDEDVALWDKAWSKAQCRMRLYFDLGMRTSGAPDNDKLALQMVPK